MRKSRTTKKRTPSKTSLKLKADKLAAAYCKSLGRCEAEGFLFECAGRFEWAHLKSRGILSLRHDPLNSLCLCWKHHRHFTLHPDQFHDFVQTHWPDRWPRLNALYMEGLKPDPAYWIGFFERNPRRSE